MSPAQFIDNVIKELMSKNIQQLIAALVDHVNQHVHNMRCISKDGTKYPLFISEDISFLDDYKNYVCVDDELILHRSMYSGLSSLHILNQNINKLTIYISLLYSDVKKFLSVNLKDHIVENREDMKMNPDDFCGMYNLPL